MITVTDLKTNKKINIHPNKKTSNKAANALTIDAEPCEGFDTVDILTNKFFKKAYKKTVLREVENCLDELTSEGFANLINGRYTLTAKGKRAF